MKCFYTLLLLSVSATHQAPVGGGLDAGLDSVFYILGRPHLKVLPLGASITCGYKSTDGNGYRKPLRDKLTSAGYGVDMIGSRQIGSMKDNDVEGWSGFVIDEVHKKAKQDYKLKPDLVLINAGTNDCTQQLDIANAPARMANLVDDLFKSIENVTVVLSGLLPNGKENECTKSMSKHYMEIARKGEAEGKKIVFADMRHGFTKDDMADETHPNDGGYKKMAASWWGAIRKAAKKKFITELIDNQS